MTRKNAVPSFVVALLSISLLTASTSFAQVIHNEVADGELSDSGAAPTALTLGLGLNVIEGSLGPNGMGASNGTSDGDFFTFNLAPGQSVTSVTSTRTGPGTQSFFGYVNSTSISAITTAGLDAGGLFGTGDLSSAAAAGLPSLSVPLTAGDHTFIFQETGGAVDYTVTFDVVPEPAGLGLAVVGLLALVGYRRRR